MAAPAPKIYNDTLRAPQIKALDKLLTEQVTDDEFKMCQEYPPPLNASQERTICRGQELELLLCRMPLSKPYILLKIKAPSDCHGKSAKKSARNRRSTPSTQFRGEKPIAFVKLAPGFHGRGEDDAARLLNFKAVLVGAFRLSAIDTDLEDAETHKHLVNKDSIVISSSP